jgi:hypothetical protein
MTPFEAAPHVNAHVLCVTASPTTISSPNAIILGKQSIAQTAGSSGTAELPDCYALRC